ncbi:CASP-like protein 2C3 [Dendrobium catenatum]|uniref:CASP-like protein n=1 Tax=Dendrobium catenatum TaxID=906689 RepID=A0A2I0W396_9ASPA|nr:CASP-like protein 2C3 [Dendrobium catenatum]PKU70132.1 CASP-like protein [Dendrobium catenatum]
MVEREVKAEGVLRLSSMVLAAISAAIVGLDEQTKTVFFTRKRATSRKLEVLWAFTIIASASSGYHLLQLCGCIAIAWLRKNHSQVANKFFAWIRLLLDQGVAYAMFAVAVAATEGSTVALRGVNPLQWSELCNIYGKFCRQVAGGLICGFAASIAMAVVSFFSARNLFKLYSVHHRREISGLKKWRWNLFYSSFS